MYIDYYNAIKTLINQGLNSIKTIDWYNRQYERFEKLKASALPAVYVEFPTPANWNTGGNGLQTAQVYITLHIVMFDVADTPEPVLTLANEIHKIIHLSVLINGPVQLSTRLMRTESELITEYDQVKVVTLTYTTTIYDCSTAPNQINSNPTLVIGQ